MHFGPPPGIKDNFSSYKSWYKTIRDLQFSHLVRDNDYVSSSLYKFSRPVALPAS